ncbi:MAG: hypothetical protein ACREPM_07695, partial [Gemmatimonadaceae bacterium]
MIATAALLLSSMVPQQPPAQKPADWRTDWSVDEGFALDIDATGFRYPTSIAVVPTPGPEPDAPLYFVAELGGTVKVVTRNHTVHVFAADVFRRMVARELPDEAGGSGMAGLCLAPAEGLIFATFGYRDTAGVFRNAIIRFESTPGRFSLTPTAQRIIAPATSLFRAAPSHQIGTCAVDGK